MSSDVGVELTQHYGLSRQHCAVPDTLTPLELPRLPPHIARPVRRARVPDPLRARVVGVVLLAHIVGIVLVDRSLGLRMRATTQPAEETVVEIRFLPPDVLEPAPPAEVAPTQDASVPRPARRQAPTAPPPQRDDGMAARFLPATPEASIETRRLFEPDGSVRLPDGFVDRSPPPARDPMAPPSAPVPFERTRFDRAWRPDGETLGQEAVRKVPLLGIVLAGVYGDPCPPNSEDPSCEANPREQRARIPPTPQSGKQPW